MSLLAILFMAPRSIILNAIRDKFVVRIILIYHILHICQSELMQIEQKH